MTTAGPFSDLIVYVDESGDHGPVSADYPVFVLAFCIFEKKQYANVVTSYMHRLKFKHFGHDAVVLHERDIRKATRPFDILQDAARRADFLNDLNTLVEVSPFTVVAAVIRKDTLRATYATPENPYHIALKFGLERVQMHREALGDSGRLHVVFESRGKKEDDELELEFRRVADDNALERRLDAEAVFVHKQANHCGLQLSDLIARPIGLHILRPTQTNRAYEIIATKLRRSPSGTVEGWGLKCFP